jgi:hypothetical protein
LRGDQIRPRAHSAGPEPLAQTTEGSDHLVGDEQEAVAVRQLAQALPVARRCNEAAARVLDRFGNEHRDRVRTLLEQHVLDLRQQGAGERHVVRNRVAEPLVLAEPETIGFRHVANLDRWGTEGGLVAIDSGERERAQARAVIGDPPGDRLRAPFTAGGVVVYRRTNFHADSTDSAPPLVKNTCPRPGGANCDNRSASPTAAGWAKLHVVANGSLAICSTAAAASSSP